MLLPFSSLASRDFSAFPAGISNIQSSMASSTSIARSFPLPASPSRALVLTAAAPRGLAVAALTFALYARTGASWWLFAALWLAPDLSMLGYLYRPCWGARIYNAAHTYVLPAILVARSRSRLRANSAYLPIALIWINHIGIDRLMGYGLKYSNGFGWTHLGLDSASRNPYRRDDCRKIDARCSSTVG